MSSIVFDVCNVYVVLLLGLAVSTATSPFSLQQTLTGHIPDSYFGWSLAFSSTGTQLAVGAPFYETNTGM